MARLLVRRCQLARQPHEVVGLKLSGFDADWFDFSVLAAASREAERTAPDMSKLIGDGNADAATAMIAYLAHLER